MNKAIAELVGTFVLVLFTVGAIVFGGVDSTVHLALAAGFVLIAAYVLVAGISGAHLNPAVTLGSVISGRTSVADAVQYWIAQFVGGIAAVFVIWLLGQISEVGDISAFGGNVENGEFGLVGTLILEALLVAFFVLVYLKAGEDDSSVVGRAVTVGLSFAAVYLIAGAATGGSANMAKSLGTAIFEGGDALADVWIYIVAGAVGAVLAGLGHVALRGLTADKAAVSS